MEQYKSCFKWESKVIRLYQVIIVTKQSNPTAIVQNIPLFNPSYKPDTMYFKYSQPHSQLKCSTNTNSIIILLEENLLTIKL